MTRKNAIIKIYELVDIPKDDTTLKEFVDGIYDNFENRTCEICKWFIKDKRGMYCNKVDFIFETSKDFCCNKWEEKI